MAKQKGQGFKDFYQDFDNFDEQELEMQYGVKVQNKGRSPKKQKKIKFDGDDIQWWLNSFPQNIQNLWKTFNSFPQPCGKLS